MINRVHRELMHAVCTNDIDAYITILLILIDIFFALNRPNYARWGILCYFKLTKAAPQIQRVLQLGAFSIRRTSKHFARSAIDLTLEQTINRDAASPMRGIVALRYMPMAIKKGALHQLSGLWL